MAVTHGRGGAHGAEINGGLTGYNGLVTAIVRDAVAEVERGARMPRRCQRSQATVEAGPDECALCRHSANCFLLGLWSWWSRNLLDLAGVRPEVFRQRVRACSDGRQN